MWFKNLKIFKLAMNIGTADELSCLLEKNRFQQSSATQMETHGWTEPREGHGLVYSIEGHHLICMRTEKKLLPASVVNQATKIRAAEIEEMQGYRPGRKQLKEIKEEITDQLMVKAFSVQQNTRAWVDTKSGWFVIDTASESKSDLIIGMLAKCFDVFPLSPISIVQDPKQAMTEWLAADCAPHGFTIDQDLEMISRTAEGSKVRYVKQSIEHDLVSRHIQEGKYCTRMAMTWGDKVSFVLDGDLNIKRVHPLDIMKQQIIDKNENEVFESDFVLMTMTLSNLISDVVDSMGGLQKPEGEE